MKEHIILKVVRLIEKGVIQESEIIKTDYKAEAVKRIKDKKKVK